MNSKQLKSLPVLSIADGEQMGTVGRAYVDIATRRVVGFAIHTKTGFFETESEPKLDADKVHTLGSGGLMLADRSAAQDAAIEERLGELATLDDLTGRAVLTEDGVSLGTVASIDFDEHTFGLTRLEVSSGILKSNRFAAISDVTTIGPDYVIVASAVASDDYVAEERPAGDAQTSRRVRWVEARTEPAQGAPTPTTEAAPPPPATEPAPPATGRSRDERGRFARPDDEG